MDDRALVLVPTDVVLDLPGVPVRAEPVALGVVVPVCAVDMTIDEDDAVVVTVEILTYPFQRHLAAIG